MRIFSYDNDKVFVVLVLQYEIIVELESNRRLIYENIQMCHIKKSPIRNRTFFCALGRNRTFNLDIKSVLLCQLSYEC